MLKWPEDLQPDYDPVQHGDIGISWFELLTSFYLSTGWRCPIRISGAGAQSKYIGYGDPEAIALPDAKRTVSLQILCFRNLLQNVGTILQYDPIPSFNSNKCYSLFRLGLKTSVAGIPCRPIIPNQRATMCFINDYLMRLNGAMALNRPIHSKSVNIVCHFEEIVEKRRIRGGH